MGMLAHKRADGARAEDEFASSLEPGFLPDRAAVVHRRFEMKRFMFSLAALGILGLVATPGFTQEEREKEKEKEKKTVVTQTGKVVKFERGDPAMVVVKTDKGETNVELAPMTFIEKNRLTFTADDDVSLRGYEVTRDGKTVFVATEVTPKGGAVVKLRDADFKPVWTTVTTTPEQPAAAIVTYTGKVRTFQKGDPSTVVLTTSKGDITAELAPVTFLEQHKVVLAPNDEIIVKGYEQVRDDGGTVFIVNEVTTKDRQIVRLRNEARSPLWVKGEVSVMKPEEIRDLTGAVTVVETTDTPDGRFVTIQTNDGPRVIALGPGSYIEKQKYVLAPGDRIVVRGWDVDRGGRRVFLASEVHRGNAVWRFRNPDGRVVWIER
jgi:hypothetical protein